MLFWPVIIGYLSIGLFLEAITIHKICTDAEIREVVMNDFKRLDVWQKGFYFMMVFSFPMIYPLFLIQND